MLKRLADKCVGTVIVLMTLVSLEYFNEIITRLREEDIEVQHYILYATKETLEKYLEKRSKGDLEKEKFGWILLKDVYFHMIIASKIQKF